MRFTALAALLAGNIHLATASLAYVLTFEPEAAHQKHKIALAGLSPSTARLVLAQRAGIENYHASFGLSDEELEAVNKFGLSTKLFKDDSSRRRAFILGPLHAEAETNTKLRLQSRFYISDPPSFEETSYLFKDFNTQAHASSHDMKDIDLFTTTSSPWFHIAPNAQSVIDLAKKLAAQKITVTALLIPEGGEHSSWGTYELPGQELVMKRQVPHRIEDEEPLSAQLTQTAPSVTANSSNSSSNYTNTTPLKGILPACFSTKKACESNTRGCTGHGSCVLKYTNKDHPDSKVSGECWGCTCGTTKTNGLSTSWAGPACQKKDISVEFWLIALFTIGLVSLITFAIGNLWSMGEEDLPSVIGAGVSGPTARK